MIYFAVKNTDHSPNEELATLKEQILKSDHPLTSCVTLQVNCYELQFLYLQNKSNPTYLKGLSC